MLDETVVSMVRALGAARLKALNANTANPVWEDLLSPAQRIANSDMEAAMLSLLLHVSSEMTDTKRLLPGVAEVQS